MSYLRLLYDYGIYHAYNRGNNKENIFISVMDKDVFLNIVRQVQIEYNFVLYGFCIMNNHYHLLFKDVQKQMPDIIGKIQENYALYFNAKYNRTGKVFESPFKSKPILGSNHFFTILSYILNNPVNAGIESDFNNYQWSSSIDSHDRWNLNDFLYVRQYYSSISIMPLHIYVKQNLGKDKLCDLEIYRMKDLEALNVLNVAAGIDGSSLQFNKTNFSEDSLANLVKELSYKGLSIRQLMKFTGLTEHFIRDNKCTKEYI